jgi:hypothetical protein
VNSNEVSFTHSGYADGDGIDFDWGTTNSEAVGNYVHDNGGAGISVFTCNMGQRTTGITLDSNLVVNSGREKTYSDLTLASYPDCGDNSTTIPSNGEVTNVVSISRNILYVDKAKGSPRAALNQSRSSSFPNQWQVGISSNVFLSADGVALLSTGLSSGDVFSYEGNAYWSATNDEGFTSADATSINLYETSVPELSPLLQMFGSTFNAATGLSAADISQALGLTGWTHP